MTSRTTVLSLELGLALFWKVGQADEGMKGGPWNAWALILRFIAITSAVPA